MLTFPADSLQHPAVLDAFREALDADAWFGAVAPAYRELLLREATVRQFARESRIYRYGDPPNGLHALLSGEVRLVSYPVPGAELVGKIIRPGNWFGELSVLDGKGRPHDAIAATMCSVLTVELAAINRIAANWPELWREIALLCCIHQRAGLKDAGRVRSEPAKKRLVRFLAAAAKASDDGVLPMTQDQIARVIGVSRQYLNKLMRELERSEILKKRYAAVVLTSKLNTDD